MSTAGDSRIFRTAYFEGPGYVPLLQAAAPLWRDLEAETGEPLLTMCGALMIGQPESVVVKGALRSARVHGLDHDLLDSTDLRRRYPQHVLEPEDVALLDAQAGFLRPERCVRVATARAEALGARLERETRVEGIEPRSGGFRVSTGRGEWDVGGVILAAGSWNPRWAPGLPLAVERVVQTWYEVADPPAFAPERFPVFIRQLADDFTRYGIPSTDGATIKVAGHGGGGPADPDRLDRETRPEDWRSTAAYVRDRLVGVHAEPVRALG